MYDNDKHVYVSSIDEGTQILIPWKQGYLNVFFKKKNKAYEIDGT